MTEDNGGNMICIKCKNRGIRYKTLKLCEECHKVHKKNVRVAWKAKTGYIPSEKHKWCNLSKDKKKEYSAKQKESREAKQWLVKEPKKSWYCTWPDKKCSKCLEVKNRKDFGSNPTIKHDRTNSKCKDCVAEDMREYRKNLGPKAPDITKAVDCECMRERRRQLKRKSVLEKMFEDRWRNRGKVNSKRGQLCEWPNKTCKKCGTQKERSSFIKEKSNSDGKGSACRDCRGLIPKKSQKELYMKKLLTANTKKKKRRLAEKLATPDWLTKAQKSEIKRIYEHMRDCRAVTGEPYEVNHVIPLRGENICGLHVPWNLEVLPRYINLALSNKFDGSR